MRPVLFAVRLSAAMLASTAFAACSGGSSTPAMKAVVASPTASATGVNGAASQRLSVVLTLRQPVAKAASVKHRAYVSPSTDGVILSVADGTASTTTSYGYDVSPAATDPNSSCGPTSATTGTRTCTLSLAAVGGDTVAISATLYDAVPGGTTDGGHALATGKTASVTIGFDQANVVGLTLAGIPAGLATTYVGADGDTAPTFEKQAMATVHAIDYAGNDIDTYDANTNYATPFTVTIADHGDDAACTPQCSGFNFGRTILTQPVSAPNTSFQTFYGDQSSSGGTNGSGAEASAKPPYYETLAITSGVSALSPASDATYVVPLFASPASLTLAGAGATAKGYAAQYHLPDGATGYTIDNACAGLVGESAASPAAYGASFTVAARTNGACTATLGDGAGDTATLPITVSGIATYLPAVNQAIDTGGSSGVAVNAVTATLGQPPNAGNTLLLIVSQGMSTNQTALAVPAGYTQIGNRASYSNLPGYAVFAKDATADSDRSVTIAYPSGVTGAISYYFVELQFTAANLITAVVAKNGQTAVPSSTTTAITPDAPNCLVYTAAMSSFVGYSALGAVTDPYTASSGYAEAFVPGATSYSAVAAASLDVQDIGVYTAASTTNTFSATANTSLNPTSNAANPDTTNIVFWIRPRAANT